MTPTVGDLFLAHSTAKLIQMTGHIGTCLLKLDPDQIWQRTGDTQNSIGNLILHLCGNVRQWIGSSIGGHPDIRDRDREFDANSRAATHELLSLLRATVSHAIGVIKYLPPDRLTDRVVTQDGERSVLEVIYQVVGHFQQHTGQIIYATKLITGEELNFYAPPKKSA